MPPKTSDQSVRYYVIPFGKKRGQISPGQPVACRDQEMVISRALRLAETPPNVGAVAVCRSSSPEDEEGTFEVLASAGEVNLDGLFEQWAK